MEKVLIVDDDQRLLKMLQRTLRYEGYEVSTAPDGEAALEIAYTLHPDVIVLDWMMPRLDGIETLLALREQGDDTPVLMLTAKDAVQDRVSGLEHGADDYLIKPFASEELLARVKALIRRSGGDRHAPLTYGELLLNPDSREVNRGARFIELTPTEFSLLQAFMQHPQQVLERQQILTRVWGYDFAGEDNVLEVYVGYLRKKLEAEGEPRIIQTVRGVGYVLRESR